MTNIEWCDKTWNPTAGCSRVSAGCENCYAERFAARGLSKSHRGLTAIGPKGPRWTGEVRLFPERLEQPLHWRKPRRIFVDSMSDLFHPDIDRRFVAKVFDTMEAYPRHTFQILTKRPGRMRELCAKGGPLYGYTKSPLPNVHLYVSIENQETADERIPHLLATPAAVRGVSAEPLLEAIYDRRTDKCRWEKMTRLAVKHEWPDCWGFEDLDHVIVGGESGPGARPCNVEGIRSIVEQCRAAEVPVFVKQDSGPKPGQQGRIPDEFWIKELPCPR